MATLLFPLIFLLVRVELMTADPAPRKVPKVYNALITSNQNLEPSKAFPVYQPVLQNALPFPYQPVVYGDYPLSPGFLPIPLPPAPANTNKKTDEVKPSTPNPTQVTEAPAVPENPEPPADDNAEKDKDVPPPPATESPIPLNEFGLPPQILPLGRVNPTYTLTHINPYSAYSYSGFGLYDPYAPFGLNPLNFASYPAYGPLNNFVPPYSRSFFGGVPAAAPTPAPEAAGTGQSTPPPEPSDLNVLNYAPKDPAIPNVPPPPLPQGGLKSEN